MPTTQNNSLGMPQ